MTERVEFRKSTGLVQNLPAGSFFGLSNKAFLTAKSGPALRYVAPNYRQSIELDLKVILQKNIIFNKRLNNFAA